jgi:hypothetical protein
MTFDTNSTTRSEALANDAVAAYEVAREVFLARINALKTAPTHEDDGKDVNAMLTIMSRAISTAVDHTKRIEDDLSKSNGGMSTGTFDLDSARAEIRVRLACLRTAGDAGGVPVATD